MGDDQKYCWVDCEYDELPCDGCVLDYGSIGDCNIVSEIGIEFKEECQYWLTESEYKARFCKTSGA